MDYVRELQSLEQALQIAEEHGNTDAASTVRGHIFGAVATCRRELERLEANPPTYGSGDYTEDVDRVGRLREVLAKYDDQGDEPAEEAQTPAKRGRAPRKENTADKTPKETA